MKAARALDNFGLVSRTRAFVGWDSSPVCSWSGIICSAQQSVIGINFTMPPQPSWTHVQPNLGHEIMPTGVPNMHCHLLISEMCSTSMAKMSTFCLPVAPFPKLYRKLLKVS